MTPTLPFISIVIPTYNRPSQLTTCLQAISCLDYPSDHFEVIVVDDGGAAPLQALMSSFQGRLNLMLLSQSNKGPGVARNRGAKHAKGQLIAFTDDDCMPAPNWLKALAARFVKSSDQAIGGRTLNALPENLYSKTSQAILDFVYTYYNVNPYHARFLASNNLAVPADLFKAVGGFDEDWSVAASEDRDLCDRWLYSGHGLLYATEAIVYHAHPLTLPSFWRQHFNYGRGACRFYMMRVRRGSGRFRPEFQFYSNLLRHPFLKEYGGWILLTLVVWLLANTAGFLWEIVNSSGGNYPRPLDRRNNRQSYIPKS